MAIEIADPAPVDQPLSDAATLPSPNDSCALDGSV